MWHHYLKKTKTRKNDLNKNVSWKINTIAGEKIFVPFLLNKLDIHVRHLTFVFSPPILVFPVSWLMLIRRIFSASHRIRPVFCLYLQKSEFKN